MFLSVGPSNCVGLLSSVEQLLCFNSEMAGAWRNSEFYFPVKKIRSGNVLE